MTTRSEIETAGIRPAGAGTGGVALTVVAALLLSFSMALTPLVYRAGLSPLALIALRPLSFVLAFWLLYRATGRSLALPPRERNAALALGVLFLLGTAGYLGSLATLPISLAVLVFYSYPLLTLVVACLFEWRRPRLLDLGALTVAFLGLALALGVELRHLHPLGLALVSSGALGVALSFYWMGRAFGGRDMAPIAVHMNLSGFGVAAAMLLASGSLSWPSAPGSHGWSLLAVVLATFVVGLFCSFRGIGLIGGVRAATIMNLEPVATIGLAVLLLGETLTASQALGAGLVIAAVLVAQRR